MKVIMELSATQTDIPAAHYMTNDAFSFWVSEWLELVNGLSESNSKDSESQW